MLLSPRREPRVPIPPKFQDSISIVLSILASCSALVKAARYCLIDSLLYEVRELDFPTTTPRTIIWSVGKAGMSPGLITIPGDMALHVTIVTLPLICFETVGSEMSKFMAPVAGDI